MGLGWGEVMDASKWGHMILSQGAILCCLSCSQQVDFKTANPDLTIFESGTALSESFTQGILSKKLDILFVVDNSGSMSEDQAKLGDKIYSFIDTLDDVDWQIGITTTDVSNGPHGIKGSLLEFDGMGSKVLTPNSPGALEAFQRTVVRRESIDCVPECPSGLEEPLRAAMMAMDKRSNENSGFFRDGADLGLLVLSDEDEMSDGPAAATSPAELVNHMRSIWGDSKRLLTYGMVIVPGDSSCFSEQGGGSYGRFVSALSSLTGGLVGSICDDDYAPTLGLIAENARKLLEFVELRQYPEEGSVEVSFSPAHITTFYMQGKRLYFDNPPAKGTVIDVDYIVK